MYQYAVGTFKQNSRMEMKGKIDYGIACAQKADTITLHHWLWQHPQFFT
jgi:hypothetical protein